MNSPSTQDPITPSRRSSRSASNAPLTPSQGTQRTPNRNHGRANEVETPLRMGGNNRPGARSIRVENSDSLNVPTSPVVPATSPLPAGVHVHDIDLSSPLNYGTPSSMGSIRTPRSGIRGTPIRVRPDIRQDRRLRQVNIGSDSVSTGNVYIHMKRLKKSIWYFT